MEVGKVIKIKRIEKDLKVKELASKVDITEQYMSNIEHGKRNPSLKLLKKLAKELGCSVYEFIEEWYKGDDWGWIGILEEYGYQDIYG